MKFTTSQDGKTLYRCASGHDEWRWFARSRKVCKVCRKELKPVKATPMSSIRYTTQFVQGELLSPVPGGGTERTFRFIRKPVREAVAATIGINSIGAVIAKSRPDGTCQLWDTAEGGPKVTEVTVNKGRTMTIKFDRDPGKDVSVVADYEYDTEDQGDDTQHQLNGVGGH